mmetsp:Transcript_6409/g.12162  ORF Transcript_6409/g.12162 Transcript_6409/m.12162 type:complete len:1038 (+) Transcript_6409:820-3933(+)
MVKCGVLIFTVKTVSSPISFKRQSILCVASLLCNNIPSIMGWEWNTWGSGWMGGGSSSAPPSSVASSHELEVSAVRDIPVASFPIAQRSQTLDIISTYLNDERASAEAAIQETQSVGIAALESDLNRRQANEKLALTIRVVSRLAANEHAILREALLLPQSSSITSVAINNDRPSALSHMSGQKQAVASINKLARNRTDLDTDCDGMFAINDGELVRSPTTNEAGPTGKHDPNKATSPQPHGCSPFRLMRHRKKWLQRNTGPTADAPGPSSAPWRLSPHLGPRRKEAEKRRALHLSFRSARPVSKGAALPGEELVSIVLAAASAAVFEEGAYCTVPKLGQPEAGEEAAVAREDTEAATVASDWLWLLRVATARSIAANGNQARALLASRVLMQLPAMSSGIGGLTILLEELVEELAPHVAAGRAATLPALQVCAQHLFSYTSTVLQSWLERPPAASRPRVLRATLRLFQLAEACQLACGQPVKPLQLHLQLAAQHRFSRLLQRARTASESPTTSHQHVGTMPRLCTMLRLDVRTATEFEQALDAPAGLVETTRRVYAILLSEELPGAMHMPVPVDKGMLKIYEAAIDLVVNTETPGRARDDTCAYVEKLFAGSVELWMRALESRLLAHCQHMLSAECWTGEVSSLPDLRTQLMRPLVEAPPELGSVAAFKQALERVLSTSILAHLGHLDAIVACHLSPSALDAAHTPPRPLAASDQHACSPNGPAPSLSLPSPRSASSSPSTSFSPGHSRNSSARKLAAGAGRRSPAVPTSPRKQRERTSGDARTHHRHRSIDRVIELFKDMWHHPVHESTLDAETKVLMALNDIHELPNLCREVFHALETKLVPTSTDAPAQSPPAASAGRLPRNAQKCLETCEAKSRAWVGLVATTMAANYRGAFSLLLGSYPAGTLAEAHGWEAAARLVSSQLGEAVATDLRQVQRILLPRVIESTFRSVWGKTVDHLHEAFSDALRVQDDQQADLDSVGTTVLFFEALLTSFGDIFRRDALRNPDSEDPESVANMRIVIETYSAICFPVSGSK